MKRSEIRKAFPSNLIPDLTGGIQNKFLPNKNSFGCFALRWRRRKSPLHPKTRFQTAFSNKQQT
jgi:hypothetical protein